MLVKIIRKMQKQHDLRKYDPTTIADYLRKQGSQIGDNCQIVPTHLGTEPYLVKIGNHVTRRTCNYI